jgi:hypothetical protein
MYELRDWIPLEKLDFRFLSSNPNAMELLLENPEKINWSRLSSNPSAIQLLEKNKNEIDWFRLCDNPEAIPLMNRLLNDSSCDFSKIGHIKYFYSEWVLLSQNQNAISILERYLDKINWYWLSTNPSAIHLLEKNMDHIEWSQLNKNPHPRAVELLEKKPEKIIWHILSTNPSALKLLEKNPDKIVWNMLAQNPNAIPLLEKHLFGDHILTTDNEIKLSGLSLNPNSDMVPLFYKYLHEDFHHIDSMEEKYKRITRETLLNLVNNKKNPNAITIIEEYVYLLGIDFLESRIVNESLHEFWELLSENPHIFVENNGMK